VPAISKKPTLPYLARARALSHIHDTQPLQYFLHDKTVALFLLVKGKPGIKGSMNALVHPFLEELQPRHPGERVSGFGAWDQERSGFLCVVVLPHKHTHIHTHTHTHTRPAVLLLCVVLFPLSDSPPGCLHKDAPQNFKALALELDSRMPLQTEGLV
jgi:hypothetical protein